MIIIGSGQVAICPDPAGLARAITY